MRRDSLSVYFYKTDSGNEPVRDFLNELSIEDKKSIGADIRTVQIGYPVGMPLTRKFENIKKLEEIRCKISDKRIIRIIFLVQDNSIVLLHIFIKKTQKTPAQEIDLAKKRMLSLLG